MLGRKKKKEEQEAQGAQEPEPRADVFASEKQIRAVLLPEEPPRDGFHEPDVSTGVDRTKLDLYTTDKLLNIYFTPTDEMLPTVTNTSKSEFLATVIGETFNEVVEQGSARKETVFKIFQRKKDRRAPSIDGDSRDALVHIHDAKAAAEQESGLGTMEFK